MNIIEQMLSKYDIETENDIVNALKGIFQEIALLGLYRGNFFSKAAFYGGTSLRILYGLNRFSEDLDFSLLEENASFEIEPYFHYIIDEFDALGISVSLTAKQKKTSNITSAFLKNETSVHTLDIKIEGLSEIISSIHSGKKLKIKIEIDTPPPFKVSNGSKNTFDACYF